jgi:hypothetical protein
MIIVSQDKRFIVNFSNIYSIGLDEANRIYYINCTFEKANGTLGIYETEERAKEVLQEIIKNIENWENLKAGQPSGICKFVYEMPKE